MLIMGIDHGNKCTGYGFVEFNSKENTIRYLSHGFIIDSKLKAPISYVYISRKIKDILVETKPDIVCLEGPKHNRGFKSQQQLVELLGCIKREIVLRNIPYVEMYPNSMKLDVAGNGWASKEQVARSLSTLFSLPFEQLVRLEYYKSGARVGEVKKYHYDGTDAIGLAYHFPNHMKQHKKLDFGGALSE